jgi:hypothetical protein
MGFVKDNFFAPQVTHYEKTVMCWLADSYQDETGYANPSVPHLATWGIMSERQVQRCLRSLQSKGIIAPVGGRLGPKASIRYCFPGLPAANARGDHQSPVGVTASHRRGDHQSPVGVTIGAKRGDQACHPNSSTEQKQEPTPSHWRRRPEWPEVPSEDGVQLKDRLTGQVFAVSKGGLWTDPSTLAGLPAAGG